MAILDVLTEPNPILRQKSDDVSSVDDDLRSFMDDMLETMYDGNGVGLAAPQVGKLKRICVLDLQDNDDMGRSRDFYPIFIINPKIERKFGKMVTAKEACLSVPNKFINIARRDWISLKYLDYYGKECSLKTRGWLSRVIQHELDHLNGKLLIDYI